MGVSTNQALIKYLFYVYLQVQLGCIFQPVSGNQTHSLTQN